MDLALKHQTDDGIVTLWLGSRERRVVVLDAWLLDQLHLFFDMLEAGAPPRGLVVMSSSPRVFVAGADLAEIDSLNDEQLHAHLTEGAEALARISALPCPTVAAIAGSALGGGLELAMHCDGILAARPAVNEKPYRLGLPEASLGICPGWGGTQLLPARIDPARAITLTATGTTLPLDQFPEGLCDRIIDHEADLYEAAVRWIGNCELDTARARPRAIDDLNRDDVREALEEVRSQVPRTPAANAVLEAIEIGIEDGFIAGLAAERRLLVSLRHTPIAREKIAGFFARQ
jgi:enoyl-CoA hydratase/carnithine racemase